VRSNLIRTLTYTHMLKKVLGIVSASGGLLAAPLAFASVDISTATSSIHDGQVAATGLAGSFSVEGVLLAVALIGAGVVIWILMHGARRAKKAFTGKF